MFDVESKHQKGETKRGLGRCKDVKRRFHRKLCTETIDKINKNDEIASSGIEYVQIASDHFRKAFNSDTAGYWDHANETSCKECVRGMGDELPFV